MNCFRPKRIKNKYNDKYLYVPCRKCDACKINSANSKAIQLAEDLSKYKYAYFIRLGYDNNSVPYIIPGMNGVFRNAEYVKVKNNWEWRKCEFSIRIDDFDTSEVDFKKCKHLRKHEVSDSVGVLYYNDIRNFFKRLRKIYGKDNIRFKYACGLEYGPRTHRPHAHVILYSNDSRFKGENLRNNVVKCWPMQNWYIFGLLFNQELFKRCDSKTAYYIASYVSGNICSSGVSEVKRFCQKVVRSKDVNFGIANKSIQKIKDFISGRNDKELSRIGNRVFEVVDTTKLNRISYKPIPNRYFRSFFPKYKGYGSISPNSFKACARRIYSLYTFGNKKELLDKQLLSALDVRFMLGFKKFKEILFNDELYNRDGHFDLVKYDDLKLFDSYLNIHQVACSLYDSLCLKYEMKDYERVGKVNYFLSKINTRADDLEQRIIKISRYCGSPQSTFDVNCPPFIRSALKNKCNKYYFRLLPKHFNQFCYDFI